MTSSKQRLHEAVGGHAIHDVPLHLSSLGEELLRGALCVLAFSVCVFAATGTYTQKVYLPGQVIAAEGQVEVHAAAAGYVSNVFATDRLAVKRGDPLFEVDSERHSKAGSVGIGIEKTLEDRRESLYAERQRLERVHMLQRAELERRVELLEQQLREREQQVVHRKSAATLAEKSLQRQTELQQLGFVSGAAYDSARSELASSQASYSDVMNDKLSIQKDLAAAQVSRTVLQLTQQNEMGQLLRQLSLIEQQFIETSRDSASVTLAASDGIVTALAIKKGQTLTTDKVALVIVPATASWQVEVYATSRDIAFLRVGNKAKLQIEAFPFQKFGLQDARVIAISLAPVTGLSVDMPLSSSERYYRITLAPERHCVNAYGRCEPLQSGMRVTGVLYGTPRTVVEWILDPLYSIVGPI